MQTHRDVFEEPETLPSDEDWAELAADNQEHHENNVLRCAPSDCRHLPAVGDNVLAQMWEDNRWLSAA